MSSGKNRKGKKARTEAEQEPSAPPPGASLAETLERERDAAESQAPPDAPEEEPAPARGPGRPKGSKSKAPPPLDPRVMEAMRCTVLVIAAPKVTEEMEAEMNQALIGAIGYVIEVRLPAVSDEWAPEVALATACVGAGVVRFRKRSRVVPGKATEVTEPDGAGAKEDRADDAPQA